MNTFFYSMRNYNDYRRRKFSSKEKYPVATIEHRRIGGCFDKANPKGGMTVVSLWLSKDCAVSGVAFCCEKDTYNKKKGKSIALGRVLRGLKEIGISIRSVTHYYGLLLTEIGKVDEGLVDQSFKGVDIK